MEAKYDEASAPTQEVEVRTSSTQRRSTRPPAFRVGTAIEYFVIMRMIGRGGMGETYLARDTKLGRKVALKVILPELLGSDQAVQQFLLEARLTAKFNHPHIVTVYAVAEHNGRPVLAFEYLEGQNLRQRMNERLPSRAETLRILLAIAEALTEAHQAGVLHRDLKPENVVVPRDGRVRVVDFGLAKAFEVAEPTDGVNPKEQALSSDQRLSPETLLAGTPQYMAPEQWLQLPCSPATDIWGLGVMLFELCSGVLPYDEPSIIKQATAVCTGDPAPRVDSLVDVAPELSELIEQCLAKDPEDRPTAEKVAEVAQALLDPGFGTRSREQSPFRGLLPFTASHAALFFGREPEVAAFLERIRVQPVLPVVGPSGVGKSSLIQAGVIPRLVEQGPWIVISVRPGLQPFHALAARVLRAQSGTDSSGRFSMTSKRPPPVDSNPALADEALLTHEKSLADELATNPRRLSLLLRALASEREANVLLFVDQLEELFTLVADDKLRRRFMDAICLGADDSTDPIRVVFTVRDDFLGRLATSPAVSEVLNQVTVIRRPDREALERILVAPVAAMGYSYDDPGSVPQMVAAVKAEPACLPLLQFAAQMLWERRDQKRKKLLHSEYEKMGGVEGALATHADGVLDGLPSEEQELARTLLLRLVTSEGTREVTERAKALEGLGEPGNRVLTQLIAARLVSITRRRGRHQGAALLELAHESLIEHWSTLAHWIVESKDELAFMTEVGQAASLWETRGCRPEELWKGEALSDALRFVDRHALEPSAQNTRFFNAARERHRWQRRRTRLFIGSVIALLTIVAAVAFIVAIFVSQKEKEASAQRHIAFTQKNEAERQRAQALRESAIAAWGQGNVLEARAKLRLALEQRDAASARGLWWQLDADPLLWRRQLGGYGFALTYSPDGSSLAVVGNEGVIYLFDIRTATSRILRDTADQTDQIFAVAFSHDGQTLATGGWQGPIRLWDVESAQVKQTLTGHAPSVWAVAFSGDGRWLASGGSDKIARLWDVRSGQVAHALSGHQDTIRNLAFSPDHRLVATASHDGTVRLWEVSSGRTIRVLSSGQSKVTSVSFNSDGRLLATGSDKTARLWEVATGSEQRVFPGHGGVGMSVSLSQDGRWLATSGKDRYVRLWDLESDVVKRVLRGHTEAIWSVQFSPDSRSLASTGPDGSVRVWNPATEQLTRNWSSHTDTVASVSFTPDGRHLASGSSDETVRLWDVDSGITARVLSDHGSRIHELRISPDGQYLATGTSSGFIFLWNLAANDRPKKLEGHAGIVRGLDFSADGRQLASAGNDGAIRLWQIPKGRLSKEIKTPAKVDTSFSVRFQPHGELLATASNDRVVHLWNAQSGAKHQEFRGHTAAIWGVSFSPDGRQLVSSGDQTVRLWDLATRSHKLLSRFPARVYQLAFHPDGKQVGVPTSDGTAALVDIESQRTTVLRGHRGEVNYFAFSPNGKLAATASDDGTVRTWQLDTARPHWRGTALAAAQSKSGTVQLLSHRGWLNLDMVPAGATRQRLPSTNPPWGPNTRGAVAERARFAYESPSAQWLCLHDYDDNIELWDLAADTQLRKHQAPGLDQVVAVVGGCVARSKGRVFIYDRSNPPRELSLEGHPSAIAYSERHLLVATDRAVFVFDQTGRPQGRYQVAGHISALTSLGLDNKDQGWIFAGYREGNLERIPTAPDAAAKNPRFAQVPSAAPVRLIMGPKGTLIAGYANGFLGIWNLSDGKHLRHTQLHGQVSHLVLRDEKLYAATDLGSFAVWNLGAFYQDYCQLLADVWKSVPVVWDNGQLVARTPPPHHLCYRQDTAKQGR